MANLGNTQQASTSQLGPPPAGPPPQGAGANDAAYQDMLKRFQQEASAMGYTLPTLVASSAGSSSNPVVQGGVTASGTNTGTDPDALQAGWNAFMQNGSTSQGNMFSHASQSAPNTPLRPGYRSKNEFERVTGDVPVDKFPYGTTDANWLDWSLRFEKAVQVSTNAYGRDRLEELCLQWISLKLNEEAQPIYSKCENRDKSWPLLRAELAEAFEDPRIKRQWARSMGAYKKTAGMTLQIYRANVIGLVNKYSPGIALDKEAYTLELYNRFVGGLEVDWREYLEESIPYTKETLNNAYSQALKYEAKLAKKGVEFSASAAMTDAEKDSVEKIRLDLEKVKTQLSTNKPQYQGGARNSGYRRDRSHDRSRSQGRGSGQGSRRDSPFPKRGERRQSSNSGRSGSSTDRSRSGSGSYKKDDLRAIQTGDEDSDSEFNKKFLENAAKTMSQAMSQALATSLKGISLKPKSSKRGLRSKKD